MILSIDEGTTGVTALVIDRQGAVVGRGYSEFTQYFPRPGWVEHDAEEIWQTVDMVVAEATEAAGVERRELAGIGITNQRETIVAWDRSTGKAVHRALVWQDRRTADMCRSFREQGWEDDLRHRTGLLFDPYFSGTKVRWLLENEPEIAARADAGELAVGTIDSWLVWKLTGGTVHVTEPTNASRTMLFNIRDRAWDTDLLDRFGIPEGILPDVQPSSHIYGHTSGEFGAEIPVAGMAGDQQAALFGQGCWKAGLGKNTYGTGAFLLMHTGDTAVASENGLLTTVACGPRGEYAYALEGAIFIAGAAVQWLRDQLGVIEVAEQTSRMAASLEDNGGVYLVPAFVGLGAPYWESEARGMLVGLTRGSGKAHLARAALEAMAYSTLDVARAMEQDSGTELRELRVDGGAVSNDWLMQFQANVLQVPVRRPGMIETTAFGAAGLAGLAVGFWETPEQFLAVGGEEAVFEPAVEASRTEPLIRDWHRAVRAARSWATDTES